MPKRSRADDDESGVSAAFSALQHIIDQTEAPSDDVARLKARIAELERVCDEMHKYASVAHAPARVLAMLDAAAHGRPITGSILPLTDADFTSAASAATLGRAGGLKGGRARANKLTPQRRTEIAREAIATRWKNRQK